MKTINDLFNIEYGQRDITSKSDLETGNTIIISSQGRDYGCYGFFNVENKYDPPFITVPRTGCIGEAFVQEFPCYVTDDLLILQSKEKMEIEKLYFVAAIIRIEKWRYNYGRKITPKRLGKIVIDFSLMDFEKIKAYRELLLEKVKKYENEQYVADTNIIKTQKTTIGQLFDINYGQRELHSKENLETGGSIVISSQGEDNGCYGFFDIETKYLKTVISVPNTGSIGMASVQEYPCCIDDNCLVLSPKEGIDISIEEMYFIAALIRLDLWRYRYGRQITAKRLGLLEVDFSKFDYNKTKALRNRVEYILSDILTPIGSYLSKPN